MLSFGACVSTSKPNGFVVNEAKQISVDAYEGNSDRYIHCRSNVYEIYDKNDKIQHIVSGGLKKYYETFGLPFRVLENSYINGGTPIYKKPNKKIIENGNIKFQGWYAIKRSN